MANQGTLTIEQYSADPDRWAVVEQAVTGAEQGQNYAVTVTENFFGYTLVAFSPVAEGGDARLETIDGDEDNASVILDLSIPVLNDIPVHTSVPVQALPNRVAGQPPVLLAYI